MVKTQQNVYYQFNCSKLGRGDILLIYIVVSSQFCIDSATLILNALNDKISVHSFSQFIIWGVPDSWKFRKQLEHSERLNVMNLDMKDHFPGH